MNILDLQLIAYPNYYLTPVSVNKIFCWRIYKLLISQFVMQILDVHTKIEEKSEIYVPYNILPLDPDSQNQAIMKYPEVHSTVQFFFWNKIYFGLFDSPVFKPELLISCFALTHRFNLQLLHLEILGACHGQRGTRRKLMRTFQTGCSPCLAFR